MGARTRPDWSRAEMLRHLAGLVSPAQRADAIPTLAAQLGVDTLVLFLPDPEIGTLLTAPGFSQTLPDAGAWRAFLASCASRPLHRGALPWPSASHLTPAIGISTGDKSVLVLVGGDPAPDQLEELAALMRLITPGLEREHRLAAMGVQLQLAHQAAKESTALAHCLDEARRAAQEGIAARKAVEAKLNEAKDQLSLTNRELEDRVRERTHRLQETVTELEAFSYTISHDMRAPLRAMRGFATMLIEDCGNKLEPEHRDYLHRINHAGQRLERLIQDVLRYSRVAREQISLHPVELESVIADVIQQHPTLQTTLADIEVRAPLPPVLGHEVMLVQCLSNLLANAVKFVAPGVRPHVVVAAEPVENFVVLSIEDNGIGIDPQYHGKIFGMFERLSSTVPVEGTGIGLAIVKRAAARIGGDVGVEPGTKGGTRFWLRLQRA